MKSNSALVLTLVSLSTTAALVADTGTRSPESAVSLPHDAEKSNRTAPAEALQIVAFWREAGPGLWFAKDPAFDKTFRDRFLSLHESAARRELSHWAETPDGALALLILLDQFPRNAFRGTAAMYSTDSIAREVAAAAIAAGHDHAVSNDMALFMYLPFGHSESLADQDRSVQLSQRLGQPTIAHAERHRDIIRRFGRFPHRNPIMGREMRPEEQEYLDAGGFAG